MDKMPIVFFVKEKSRRSNSSYKVSQRIMQVQETSHNIFKTQLHKIEQLHRYFFPSSFSLILLNQIINPMHDLICSNCLHNSKLILLIFFSTDKELNYRLLSVGLTELHSVNKCIQHSAVVTVTAHVLLHNGFSASRLMLLNQSS